MDRPGIGPGRRRTPGWPRRADARGPGSAARRAGRARGRSARPGTAGVQRVDLDEAEPVRPPRPGGELREVPEVAHAPGPLGTAASRAARAPRTPAPRAREPARGRRRDGPGRCGRRERWRGGCGCRRGVGARARSARAQQGTRRRCRSAAALRPGSGPSTLRNSAMPHRRARRPRAPGTARSPIRRRVRAGGGPPVPIQCRRRRPAGGFPGAGRRGRGQTTVGGSRRWCSSGLAQGQCSRIAPGADASTPSAARAATIAAGGGLDRAARRRGVGGGDAVQSGQPGKGHRVIRLPTRYPWRWARWSAARRRRAGARWSGGRRRRAEVRWSGAPRRSRRSTSRAAPSPGRRPRKSGEQVRLRAFGEGVEQQVSRCGHGGPP